MTQSRFFQVSLVLPVAVWILGLLIFSLVIEQASGEFQNNLYNGHHIIVPYLIFAAVIWKLVENKSYGLLIVMAFVVPILWGCFFTLWYVVVKYILTGDTDTWIVLLIMAFWATFVAYLFEIIPLCLLGKFKTDLKTVDRTDAVTSPM